MSPRSSFWRLTVITFCGAGWLAGGWLVLGRDSWPVVGCVCVGFFGGGVAGLIGHLLGAGVWSWAIAGMVRMLSVASGLFVLHHLSPIPINRVLFAVACFLCLLFVDSFLAVRMIAGPSPVKLSS